MCLIVAGIGEPCGGLGVSFDDALVWNLRGEEAGQQASGEAGFHDLPRKVAR